MRIHVIVLIFLFCFTGCVMEPPTTFYSFTIKNNTDSLLIIDSYSIKDEYTYHDTLKAGQAFNRSIYKIQCFVDYKDTLILSFFKELKLRVPNKEVTTDPFKRSNWVEKLDSLTNGNCRGGTCNYTLTITKKDIK